jgi:hypothetical protein
LEINSDKTRLIEFGRFAEATRAGSGEGKPETFEFLGFTHIYSRQGSIQKRGQAAFLLLLVPAMTKRRILIYNKFI